ncbi:ATP synthase F0 subunit B [Desulfobulbus sp. US1]|nr:ATP synthase F0 subunit B [Desulfobulbus sp. US4]MCW5207610.1 ATP synthase F0 subunit B [Desulfobulbus sp. US2]MCW5208653.1 ATP synthase F0 subunit B [Desulfobulbus sp. US1]WLE96257.1 MAG: ATP synthase F0 subunit B [Candidatus Electrothrix communis]
MKARSMKKIVPILFAVGLCGGMCTLSFAQQHGEEGHPVEQAAVYEQHTEQQAEHQNPAAGTLEGEHGDGALEAHGPAEHSEHAAAGHGESHGEGHVAPMITKAKLWDLLWRALNFAALVFIMVKFLSKPIAAGLGGRKRQIQDELETMQEKRDEAEQAYKAFELRLAGMEGEMLELVEKAKAMAEDEKSRILAEAEASAKEVQRQAEAAVEGALAHAKSKLQAEIAEQAVVMAEELIVKNLTPEDQVAITEQYLERVGAVQ